MTLPIRFVAEAREEFRAQIARYAELDPRLARRFADVVEAEVSRLSVFPGSGPPLEGEYRQRVLPRPFPFSVVFAVEDETLVVVAVWAQRRDPRVLHARLRGREPGS